jgi:large subunit ribosomal protein L21
MYAIIRVGGHQEKVSVGEQITVDHLKQDPGSEVSFTPLMVSADDGEVVTDHKELTDKGSVKGTVVLHAKGEKLEVFQYRQKTGFRRHIGHRQLYTLVEISEIRLGEKVSTLSEVREAEEKAKTEREAASKAAAEAKLARKAEEKKTKAATAAKKKSAAKTQAGTAAAGSKKTATKKAAAKKPAAKKKTQAAKEEE